MGQKIHPCKKKTLILSLNGSVIIEDRSSANLVNYAVVTKVDVEISISRLK